jgi:hypothetical protein
MMKNTAWIVLLFLGVFVFTIGCNKNTVDLENASTFENIQTQLLNTSCAVSGCHLSESDATFPQHELILTSGKAYENLVNAIAKNQTAKEENLERVLPFDAENSLLYQKMLFETTHKSNKNFGSIMPLGKDMLFTGQIEYIRRWIEAGAPKEGNVVDISLLADQTPVLKNFEALAAPSTGEGFQMKLQPFEIYPYFEREIFVHKPLNNTENVFVNKFQLKMHPGSHHFILYGFRNKQSLPPVNEIRDLRNKDLSFNYTTLQQIGNHVFYFGGSESNFTFNFPEGTAVELPANMTFDVNSHYFNKGAKSYNGEVYINLYTVPKEKVKKTLKVLDLGNTSFVLPPNKTTTVTKDFKFDKNVKIVTLFSHTHKLGEKFEVLIKGGTRNGEVIYTSTNWEHPAKIDFANPIALKAGESLTSRITYNNYTDQSIRFGFTSDDEMGIIFGYYYDE